MKSGRKKSTKFPQSIHLQPKTPKQQQYLEALKLADQVIVTGSAGTGKTFIAASWGAKQYLEGSINKIILTRPNVASGRSLGFFAGTMEEKMGHWVVPFTEVLKQQLGEGVYDTAVRNRNIEVVPFEVMRGRTFDNAFVILDEAQNTTPHEIKMFLTRIGEYSQVVVNGDIKQSDLKTNSGLKVVLDLIKEKNLPIPVIEFTLDDIVRSGICAMWVRAFEEAGI